MEVRQQLLMSADICACCRCAIKNVDRYWQLYTKLYCPSSHVLSLAWPIIPIMLHIISPNFSVQHATVFYEYILFMTCVIGNVCGDVTCILCNFLLWIETPHFSSKRTQYFSLMGSQYISSMRVQQSSSLRIRIHDLVFTNTMPTTLNNQ